MPTSRTRVLPHSSGSNSPSLDYLTAKIEAVRPSETSVKGYHLTRCRIVEALNLQGLFNLPQRSGSRIRRRLQVSDHSYIYSCDPNRTPETRTDHRFYVQCQPEMNVINIFFESFFYLLYLVCRGSMNFIMYFLFSDFKGVNNLCLLLFH